MAKLFGLKQLKFLGSATHAIIKGGFSKKGVAALGGAYRSAKKEWPKGAGKAVKVALGTLADKSIKAVLAAPKKTFDQRYTAFVKAGKNKYGSKWRAPSQFTFAKGKKGPDQWVGPDPHFNKMGKRAFHPVQDWLHSHKGILGTVGGSALLLGIGFGSDKSNAGGGVRVGGVKVQVDKKYLHVANPEGHGGRLDLGVIVSGNKTKWVDTGVSVGYGKARSAGIAHQAGAHLKIQTPIVKTDLAYKEQHAFGLKKRSRRVAAIRRAVFGNEQFLGAKKMSKGQRQADSL